MESRMYFDQEALSGTPPIMLCQQPYTLSEHDFNSSEPLEESWGQEGKRWKRGFKIFVNIVGQGRGVLGFAVGLTLCPLLVGMCHSDPDRGGLEFGDV